MIFSIIIPCYNVEKHIIRCLDSIYNQNFDKTKFEVIIVDDESPDNVVSIAENYLLNKENFKIISQKNKGLGGARNTGLENAKGEYIIFLDADDWLLDNSLIELSNIINSEDIIEFSVSLKDDSSEIKEINFENSNVLKGVDYFILENTINSACNKAYKRAFLEKNSLKFVEKIYGEDIEFNSRAFLYAQKIKSINNKLIVFYQSDNSITRNDDINKKIKYFSDLLNTILNLNKLKLSLDKQYKKEINYLSVRICSLIVNSILFALKNKLLEKELFSFINTLKQNNAYIMNVKIKERNIYRLLFKQNIALNLIINLNKFR